MKKMKIEKKIQKGGGSFPQVSVELKMTRNINNKVHAYSIIIYIFLIKAHKLSLINIKKVLIETPIGKTLLLLINLFLATRVLNATVRNNEIRCASRTFVFASIITFKMIFLHFSYCLNTQLWYSGAYMYTTHKIAYMNKNEIYFKCLTWRYM